jgi:energy-coupling factor transporter transmembrane protein EcfT
LTSLSTVPSVSSYVFFLLVIFIFSLVVSLTWKIGLESLWPMVAEVNWEGCHHRDCWRKIYTSRQAHSKPNKLASHAKRSQDLLVNFPWKLTKDKVVKFQSLELAGWYQTVPYLRLGSQVRWHIAIRSYLPANWNHSGL